MVCLGLVREILGSSTFGRHFPDIRSVLSHSRDYLLSKHAAFMVLWLHFVNEFFEHLNIQLIQCTHFIFEKTFFICSQEKYKVDHIKVNNDAIDQTVL